MVEKFAKVVYNMPMLNHSGKIVPTVRGVITRNGKFLIIQRSATDSWNAGKWEFPGGKIDFGQDINEALKREIKEESGLDVVVKEPLFFWDENIESPRYKGKILASMYFACEAPLNAKVILSEEHQGCKWIEFEELKRFDQELANHTQEALQRLIKAEV